MHMKNISNIIKSLFILLTIISLQSFADAATIIVDIAVEDNLACSFESAIESANTDTSVNGCVAGSGDDTIIFSAGIAGQEITIPGGVVPNINSNTVIQGEGSVGTVIDLATTDGIPIVTDNVDNIVVTITNLELKNSPRNGISVTSQVANVTPGTVNLENVHVHDNTLSGVNFYRQYSITRDVDLNIINSNISDNQSTGIYIDECAGDTVTIKNTLIQNNSGFLAGGVYAKCGHVIIEDSTITGNSTSGSGGGVYINEGRTAETGFAGASTKVEITNSTIEGNAAGASGGGIYLGDGALVSQSPELTLVHSTIANNTAPNGAGIELAGNDATAMINISNSVFDNEAGGGNCSISVGVTFDTDTGNVASDGTCGGNFTNPGTDLGLAALADNGGTIAIGPGGLLGNTLTMAIDIADAFLYNLATASAIVRDQRGTLRPQLGAPDVGAFEATNTPPVITSNGGGDTAAITLVEGGNAITTVTATDTEDDATATALTYSISGGADAGVVSIDSATGVLTFNNPTDFSNPVDTDTNNVYLVNVTVTDSGNLIDEQELTITITEASTPTSSRSGGSSRNYVCKDPDATNYSRFGTNRSSLCEYEDDEPETPKVIVTEEEVVPTITPSICPIFTQHTRKGDRDGKVGQDKQEDGVSSTINEISLLQTALTGLGFNAGPIDGIFGTKTDAGVRAWQQSHFDAVLAPWNLSGPTGRFYQSSERWMNEILGCDDTVTLDNGKYLAE